MNILFSDWNEFDKINPHCLLFYFFAHMCQIFWHKRKFVFPSRHRSWAALLSLVILPLEETCKEVTPNDQGSFNQWTETVIEASLSISAFIYKQICL